MKELTDEVLDVIYADLKRRAQKEFHDDEELTAYLGGVSDGLEACKSFLEKP